MSDQDPQRPRRRVIRIATPHDPELEERMSRIQEYYQMLFRLTPFVFVNLVLVGLNILVFVGMVSSGMSAFSPATGKLLEWGANSGPLTLNGDWWRLFTSMFIHIGLMHIVFNMWVLWDLGNLVERLLGNTGYLLLYIISGGVGSLASVLWKVDAVSAGASGAIFGVFGGLLGFLLLRRDSVPPEILSRLRNNGIFFLFINIVLGMSIPMIDMAAHMGGLVAGFLGGMILSQPIVLEARHKRTPRNLLLAVLGSAVLFAGFTFAPRSPERLASAKAKLQLQKVLRGFDKLERQQYKQTRKVIRAYKAKKIDKTRLLRELKQIQARWAETAKRFANVDLSTLKAPKKKLFQTLRHYLQLRQTSLKWRMKLIQRPKPIARAATSQPSSQAASQPSSTPMNYLQIKAKFIQTQKELERVIGEIHFQQNRHMRKKRRRFGPPPM